MNAETTLSLLALLLASKGSVTLRLNSDHTQAEVVVGDYRAYGSGWEEWSESGPADISSLVFMAAKATILRDAKS